MLVSLAAGNTVKLREPPKDFATKQHWDNQVVARLTTSGMVTMRMYEPLVLGGEMGNLQPSPDHPCTRGCWMLFTGQMVVGRSLEIGLRYGRAPRETVGVVTPQSTGGGERYSGSSLSWATVVARNCIS